MCCVTTTLLLLARAAPTGATMSGAKQVRPAVTASCRDGGTLHAASTSEIVLQRVLVFQEQSACGRI